MKTLSRIVIALIIIAMTLPMALACAETVEQEETTAATVVTQAPAATEETTTEETLFAPSNIPDDLKFEGTTLSILHWDDAHLVEFFAEAENGEAVNDAIYWRNEKIEDQFGITLEFTGMNGNYSNRKKFVNACVNNVMSGADVYDMFCGYSMTGASIMSEGISQDLTNYDILDLDSPWWPKSLISKARIKDGVYFVSGDISTNFLYMMYLCIFNKDLFASIKQQDVSVLYNLVHDGEWTIDKLLEYTNDTYLDLDADQAVSEGDRFGITVTSTHNDSFYTGADLESVYVNADGDLAMSEDLFSERTVNLLEKVCDLIHNSGNGYNKKGVEIFANGTVLFVVDRPNVIATNLTSVDFSFGILPIPKYDTNQDGYKTCLSFPYTVYMISTASKNAEAAAATIELMAYENYVNVTPVLFEETMKARYADQSDDSFMFDYIREGVVIDIGRLFCIQLDNMSYSIFRTAVNKNAAGSYASSASQYSKTFNIMLNDINKSLDKLK